MYKGVFQRLGDWYTSRDRYTSCIRLMYKGPKLGTYSDWGLSSVLVINKHLSHQRLLYPLYMSLSKTGRLIYISRLRDVSKVTQHTASHCNTLQHSCSKLPSDIHHLMIDIHHLETAERSFSKTGFLINETRDCKEKAKKEKKSDCTPKGAFQRLGFLYMRLEIERKKRKKKKEK